MNILVVGAGVVGEALAEQLSQEGHRVALVDRDRAKVARLQEKLDVLAVCGEAGMPSVLERAGVKQAQMVIAVTNSDEVNIVVGMLSGRLQVQHCIVRVRNREYTDDGSLLSLSDLGIDQVINPEPVMVEALEHMVAIPGSSDFAKLAGGQVLMLGFDIAAGSPLAGRSLAELRELSSLDAFLVLYLHRGDQVIVPRGHDRIEAGDNVHLLVSADTLHFVAPLVHATPKRVKRILVAGASRVAEDFARRVSGHVENVFLLVSDSQQAEEVAGKMPGVTVLEGEATDLDLLNEAGLEQCDLFCALSDSEQQNMMSALLAKRHSRTATAVLVNQPEYVPVMDSLGVDIVLNPRLVTVGEILMHVRRGHVHSVTRLAESRAELIEFEVAAGSPITERALKDVAFPRNALLGAVVREDVMEIPRGTTQVRAGDIAVVFAMPEAIPAIEKLFAHRQRW